MGIFINKGNRSFAESRNGEYVDKSPLIALVNETLNSERRFSCVTRSRRFGKSMAAKMLCAYYDRTCDSSSLFSDLDIASHDSQTGVLKYSSYPVYLNKFHVMYVDMTQFVTRFRDTPQQIVPRMQKDIQAELLETFDIQGSKPDDDLMLTLQRTAMGTGIKFFVIIDEWDALFRDFPGHAQVQDEYINLLRRMFKDEIASAVFAGVYMTGILPVKKYKTQSALNNFVEYSMVQPQKLDRFFGFTKDEVQVLCDRHGMDYDEMELWYDGYRIGRTSSVFNPNSVMQAVYSGECDSYWASTGAYDNVNEYIRLNYDGLKDDVIRMLAGGRCKVNTTSFLNDLSIINNRDDVLTVLIHLGYLAFDKVSKECYIPNKEVGDEMVNAVNASDWTILANSIDSSEKLLQATLRGDEEAVAAGIDLAHDENTSILSYNDENSLSCVLSIAYYYARNEYIIHRELASGKGFADIVLIPRKHVAKPAIVIELKYNKNVDAAIAQIKAKRYASVLKDYTGEVLLVGVTYGKTTKRHTCKIERLQV